MNVDFTISHIHIVSLQLVTFSFCWIEFNIHNNAVQSTNYNNNNVPEWPWDILNCISIHPQAELWHILAAAVLKRSSNTTANNIHYEKIRHTNPRLYFLSVPEPSIHPFPTARAPLLLLLLFLLLLWARQPP